MEAVVNILEPITLDIVKASQHIKQILQLLQSHHDNPEKVAEVLKDATLVAKKDGLLEEITSIPRIIGKQLH